MRVISGTARGKKLISLEGMNTRPTLDRVKEALFNILQFNIKDKIVLDLFAGSGAIGIEALSRGAKLAAFCDNSHEAINIIKTNIVNTKNAEKSLILNCDYIQALKQLKNKQINFDVIYLDPPYKTEFAEIAIKEIINLNLLSKDGIIILETDDTEKERIIEEQRVEIFDKRKYGRAILIFIRKG